MTFTVFEHASGQARIDAAVQWLSDRGEGSRVDVVGPSLEASRGLVRAALAESEKHGSFGWNASTYEAWMTERGLRVLAKEGVRPVSKSVLLAVVRGVGFEMARAGGLSRLKVAVSQPGFAECVYALLDELRRSEIEPTRIADLEIREFYTRYQSALVSSGFGDRAALLRAACRAMEVEFSDGAGRAPTLFLDVPLRSALDAKLFVLLSNQGECFLTIAKGDSRSRSHLQSAWAQGAKSTAKLENSTQVEEAKTSVLVRAQERLFSNAGVSVRGQEGAESSVLEKRQDAVDVFSAPSESRECIELARQILSLASQGVRFEDVAIVLRSPALYRSHLSEAFRRSRVPHTFSHGTRLPDPSGRAFLAILLCKEEKLSAKRFAEYCSLGELPDKEGVTAPRWTPSEEVLLARRTLDGEEEEGSSTYEENPRRFPIRWEALVTDAAVIGGLARWKRRLEGLKNELQLDRDEQRRLGEETAGTEKRLLELEELATFSIPLLEILEGLPNVATWGEWVRALGNLAERSLRSPERVLAVLAEFHPMASVESVTLADVISILSPRLLEVTHKVGANDGAVTVLSTEEVRGRTFAYVFVPGLAEKLFPGRIFDEPLLTDADRRLLGLATVEDHTEAERLLLRLAVGAARTKVIASYPRLEVVQGKARTPSFYLLDLLHAAEGKWPTFESLSQRAREATHARIGWPAPTDPLTAIDESEHDLALFDRMLNTSDKTPKQGIARYLLSANPHLARALRFRNERWFKKWSKADGLVDPSPLARLSLSKHALTARSYSPTALQNFSQCPYRFYLSAILRLAVREEARAIEEMDALQRGSFVHDVQFAFFRKLRARGLLPVKRETEHTAKEILVETLKEVGDEYCDRLAPVIRRVWDDEMDAISADLREMLRRMVLEEEWIPAQFELSFGLKERRGKDEASVNEAVMLDQGISVRGSIDLVEKNVGGSLRATDYKTGKARVKQGSVIEGGKSLQPVLYALVVEKIAVNTKVEGGRLYYCSSTGDFTSTWVPLDTLARESITLLATTLRSSIERGFFPAYPEKDGCRYCDHKGICGPYEEERARRKKEGFEGLTKLRKHA